MIGLRGCLAVAGAVAGLGALGYIWTLRADNATLTANIAGYERSIAALTLQSEQSALARRVETARAERHAARVAELNTTIEALLTGEIPDAPLDPAVADFVNGLRNTAD